MDALEDDSTIVELSDPIVFLGGVAAIVGAGTLDAGMSLVRLGAVVQAESPNNKNNITNFIIASIDKIYHSIAGDIHYKNELS